MKDLPVGVFDSGVGGISVLSEMVRLLPGEDFLFYGDNANAPYGVKPREEIRRLAKECARHLYTRGIKALVVACNTATSAAIEDLRREYTDIPVIGIEPALKPAVMTGSHPCVVVMATPMTVEGDKFHMLSDRFKEQAEVIALPCPGLMEYVEEGLYDSPIVEEYLTALLQPVLGQKHVDAIVLGCTHYPFVRNRICQVAARLTGRNVQILDGSEGTARQLKRRLEEMDLCAPGTGRGTITFEMSLPGREDFCRMLLERRMDQR